MDVALTPLTALGIYISQNPQHDRVCVVVTTNGENKRKERERSRVQIAQNLSIMG